MSISDFPEVVGDLNSRYKRKPGPSNVCAILCPCICSEDETTVSDGKDTSKGLLADQSNSEKDNNHMTGYPPPYSSNGTDGGAITPTEAGAVYRTATTPSAPALDLYPDVEMKGQHFYDRSDSVPVQAST